MTAAVHALLVIYAVAILAAALGVWMARKCCNGVGECGRCTAVRGVYALLRSAAVPAAVLCGLPALWRAAADVQDDWARLQRTVRALPGLWDAVTVLAVRHTCCDASTGARVGFVDYVQRHLEVPGVLEDILRGRRG